ncbi:MAG: amino acid transporter [Rhodoluna sp.]|nr:amino acid transporter [Rhodoluna sp.]MBP6187159.1 amino acid transporter [Rhodoluna sp.]
MIAFLPGFFAGLSLIVAIGAQNAFVIRQGLTRQHVFVVVAICALADAALIALGIAGLGAIIQGLPWLLEVIRWFGVAYLTWFGIKSVRSAFKSEVMDTSGAQTTSLKKVVTSVLGFTLLNPHVYLDTVILLGSISNQFADNRWVFGFGAMAASVVWFSSIGFGAKAASRFMSKPIFWRVLDSLIAVVMFSIALYLAFAKLS